MVLGWSRRVPDPCALFWYLHNFGAHIRVYDTGRYSSKIANRLMKAPLGEVMRRRIGYLKNIIMDKVEDLEPALGACNSRTDF